MKVSLARDDFAQAVGWVSRAVGARAYLPALSGVHLHASGDTLTLTAYNLETALSFPVEAAVHEPGEALIPATRLALAKSLPPRRVDLSVVQDRAEVACGGVKLTARCLQVEDYPTVPRVEADATEVDGADWAEAVAAVAVAASRDISREALIGLHLRGADGALTLTATDSFRAHRRIIDFAGSLDVHAPAAPLPWLEAETVGIAADRRTLRLSAGPTVTTGRLEAAAPNVDGGVVDRMPEHVTRAEVDAEALVEACKRAAQVGPAVTDGHLLMLHFGDGLRVTGSDEGDEYDERVEAEVEGEPQRAAVNSRYLMDAVKSWRSERVVFDLPPEMSDRSRPFHLYDPERREGEFTIVMSVKP